MRVVAITELKGDLETEAPWLAAQLGVTAYDVRARLASGLPRILVQTPDAAFAQRLRQALVGRGHGAVECDAAAASGPRVKLHRFTMDGVGMTANDQGPDHFAWTDLGVVVVALLRSETTRTVDELEYALRALQQKHESTRTDIGVSHVAYLFPRPDAADRRPWVFDEAGAQFVSLGPRMQPTRRANFFATLAWMRDLAPRAIIDDRYVTHPQTLSAVLQVGAGDALQALSSSAAVDLTVHILAGWLQRGRGGPYRG